MLKFAIIAQHAVILALCIFVTPWFAALWVIPGLAGAVLWLTVRSTFRDLAKTQRRMEAPCIEHDPR